MNNKDVTRVSVVPYHETTTMTTMVRVIKRQRKKKKPKEQPSPHLLSHLPYYPHASQPVLLKPSPYPFLQSLPHNSSLYSSKSGLDQIDDCTLFCLPIRKSLSKLVKAEKPFAASFLCLWNILTSLFHVQVYKVVVNSAGRTWFIFRRYNEFHSLYEKVRLQFSFLSFFFFFIKLQFFCIFSCFNLKKIPCYNCLIMIIFGIKKSMYNCLEALIELRKSFVFNNHFTTQSILNLIKSLKDYFKFY